MMTTNHTPGPWIAQLNQVGADYVHIGTEGPDGVCEVQWNGSDENQEANARLIAAAPDLLETLEKIASSDGSLHGTCVRDLKEIARAAINKAKGV
jgi:hypothetical protein